MGKVLAFCSCSAGLKDETFSQKVFQGKRRKSGSHIGVFG
jgi:hypothetical protein